MPSQPETIEPVNDPSPQPGVFGTVALGLRVLGSEMAWLATSGLRALELRQMRRRLGEEYALLGRLTAKQAEAEESGAADAPSQEELDLALGQIDFLRQEIARMEEERGNLRQHFVHDRRARLNMDHADQSTTPPDTEAS